MAINEMEYILITNDTDKVEIANSIGIHRIMIDLEIMGKYERQGHLDTLISSHSMEDITRIGKLIDKSKLMVRINPIHEYSQDEVDEVIARGAEIIMLPMFTTKREVEEFIKLVDGRATTCLLLETAPAMVRIDDILEVAGINEIHVGLNDLHLDLKLDFMFEILSSGLLEYIFNKIKKKNIKYGFGGIARIGGNAPLKSEIVLSEHKRLGSSMVILSRDFSQKTPNDELQEEFLKVIRKNTEIDTYTSEDLEINKFIAMEMIHKVIN